VPDAWKLVEWQVMAESPGVDAAADVTPAEDSNARMKIPTTLSKINFIVHLNVEFKWFHHVVQIEILDLDSDFSRQIERFSRCDEITRDIDVS